MPTFDPATPAPVGGIGSGGGGDGSSGGGDGGSSDRSKRGARLTVGIALAVLLLLILLALAVVAWGKLRRDHDQQPRPNPRAGEQDHGGALNSRSIYLNPSFAPDLASPPVPERAEPAGLAAAGRGGAPAAPRAPRSAGGTAGASHARRTATYVPGGSEGGYETYNGGIGYELPSAEQMRKYDELRYASAEPGVDSEGYEIPGDPADDPSEEPGGPRSDTRARAPGSTVAIAAELVLYTALRRAGCMGLHICR